MFPDNFPLVPHCSSAFVPGMPLDPPNSEDQKNGLDQEAINSLLNQLKTVFDDVEQIDEILSSLNNVDQVINKEGTTLLIWATQNGFFKIAHGLIHRGASVQLTDKKFAYSFTLCYSDTFYGNQGELVSENRS